MWYAKADGGRISCGTFTAQPDGSATVSMSAPVSSVAYPEIEITQEPDDGDPGSSGKVVLKGSLRDLLIGTPRPPSRFARTVGCEVVHGLGGSRTARRPVRAHRRSGANDHPDVRF